MTAESIFDVCMKMCKLSELAVAMSIQDKLIPTRCDWRKV